MILPPAGWHIDPHDPAQWRYWDGSQWTEHRAPREAQQQVHIAETTTAVVKVATDAGERQDQVVEGFSITRKTSTKSRKSPTVAEVISRMQLEPPRHPLEEQIEVAGEIYHVKGIKRVYKEFGLPITSAGATIDDVECVLVPEPWNPHDSNAVAVAVGTNHVGYLPAETAENYAEPLLELAKQSKLITGQARIWALDEGGIVRARVTILVPEPAALS